MPSNGSSWPPPAGGVTTPAAFPTAPPFYPPAPPLWSPRPIAAAPPPKPRRRRVWPIAAVAGGVVVIALLAVSVAMVWSTRSQLRDVRREMITSRDDLRRARSDLKRVQSQLADAQASADGLDGLIADLQDQVDALQEQVDELERQAAAGPASVGPSVAAGPTLGDRLGNPPALTTDGTLGAVIASTDARCLLGAAGDAALTAPRSMPELTGQSPSDVSEIISRVELLRHESVDPDPEVQVLTGNEFDSLVQAQLGPIPAADIADEKSMLELLGAVPPGYDLAGAYGDAPSGIAGFYDPSDGVVRVRRRDGSDGLGPIWEVVLAHEVDHAIDDSAFGLPGDLATDVDSELAATAIGEGDATIAMQLYASTYLGLPAELSALAEASARNPAAGYPPYLLAQAQFPYVEGARYLCYRYLQGGWNRVDREFLAVPATTYQVMFPERQQAAAVVPSEVGAVPPGWEGTGIESFGAANVMWLLQAPGADATKALPGARDAAGDWRGGAVSVFRHGGSSAVALRLSTASGALCAAMSNWYAAMRPGATRSDNGDAVEFTEADHVARVRCVAGEVHVAIGPSAAVVDPLAD